MKPKMRTHFYFWLPFLFAAFSSHSAHLCIKQFVTIFSQSDFRILTLEEGGWTEVEDETRTLLELDLGPRAAIQLAPVKGPVEGPGMVYQEMKKHIGTRTYKN